MVDTTCELPFGSSFKEKIDFWNIQCTKYFRRFTYNRLRQLFPGQFLSLIGVFVVNTMWHGFYPGTMIMTMSMALIIEAAKVLYRFWTNKIKGGILFTDIEVGLFSSVCQMLVSSSLFLIIDLQTWARTK